MFEFERLHGPVDPLTLSNVSIFKFSMEIFVTDHEEHTLMRRFDHDGDGKINMEELYNTLAASE